MNLMTCSETRRRRSISPNQRAVGDEDRHQNVETVIELANGVAQPAAAHLLSRLHLSATIGNVLFEASISLSRSASSTSGRTMYITS